MKVVYIPYCFIVDNVDLVASINERITKPSGLSVFWIGIVISFGMMFVGAYHVNNPEIRCAWHIPYIVGVCGTLLVR